MEVYRYKGIMPDPWDIGIALAVSASGAVIVTVPEREASGVAAVTAVMVSEESCRSDASDSLRRLWVYEDMLPPASRMLTPASRMLTPASRMVTSAASSAAAAAAESATAVSICLDAACLLVGMVMQPAGPVFDTGGSQEAATVAAVEPTWPTRL